MKVALSALPGHRAAVVTIDTHQVPLGPRVATTPLPADSSDAVSLDAAAQGAADG